MATSPFGGGGLAWAVRALAGATLAVRPVEDADMLSDLFLLEQPIQHRRGGECRKRLQSGLNTPLRTALKMRSKLQCPAGVAPPEDDTLRMSGTRKVATANASMIA